MKIVHLITILMILSYSDLFAQSSKPTMGPVFNQIGPVYDLDDVDFLPDPSKEMKAIFDVDKYQENLNDKNSIISSLHRYLNMHVRHGIPEENIHLALVFHGHSTKNALRSDRHKDEFGVENPNTELIKTLAEKGVDIYICGQSMSHQGFTKNDLLPVVKVALSAMTVLTIYQMKNYALIQF